jgi:GNAT superfamily N-acetyltransferase
MTAGAQVPESVYKIEQLGPDQFDLLLPIMKDAFGKTVDVGYFRWKFIDNPAGHFLGFIARSPEGEIGAYYGVIPERYNVAGKVRTLYQSCDTMTHSQHRRRGLFQMLALHCYQHLRDRGELFVIGFGGGQSTPGFLKFGWRQLFDVRPFMLPAPLCALKRLLPAPNRMTVREVKRAEQIGPLIEESDRTSAIHLIKDKHFLEWRLANPRRTYRIFVAEFGGRVAGYAIVYVDDRKLWLLDLYAANDRAAERALFLEMCKMVAQENLKGIVTIAQERTPYADALGRAGMFTNRTRWGPLREAIPFIIYAEESEMDRFSKPENWNITPADHDAL